MTLMPSLADCHVHLVYTGGPDPNAQMNKQGPAQITLTALENAQASLRGGVTSCATAAARTTWNSACATPSRAASSPVRRSGRPAASSA